ncbi:immunity 49 family protein [Algibacillus agarilyticus]|uniref:immunity 49 family protein n=1 Tax=Algibacillus agarilyticus TaxID=2234133 RepID=UPI001300817C|nr:immunity 49 family protein [Algibacillus agarilyticus]
MKISHFPYENCQIRYEFALEEYNGSWKTRYPKNYIKGQGANNGAFSSSEDFYRYFCFCFIANEHNHSLKFLKLSHQLRQAYYHLALNQGSEYTFYIDGANFNAIGEKTFNSTNVKPWSQALALAMMVRDKAAIDNLCQYKVENFYHPQVEFLPFHTAFCNFLKGVFDAEADLKALLAEVMHSSNPNLIPARMQSYIYRVCMPFVNVLLAVVHGHEGEYQKRLTKALADNRQHFANKQREDIAVGWVPPFLCAAAVLAFDKHGFKMPEPNAYIPEWLAYGEFDYSDFNPVVSIIPPTEAYVDKPIYVEKDISFELKADTNRKRTALTKAAKQFLADNELEKRDFAIDFLGEEGYLAAYSLHTITIKHLDDWLPDIKQKWQQKMSEVMGDNPNTQVVIK